MITQIKNLIDTLISNHKAPKLTTCVYISPIEIYNKDIFSVIPTQIMSGRYFCLDESLNQYALVYWSSENFITYFNTRNNLVLFDGFDNIFKQVQMEQSIKR